MELYPWLKPCSVARPVESWPFDSGLPHPLEAPCAVITHLVKKQAGRAYMES